MRDVTVVLILQEDSIMKSVTKIAAAVFAASALLISTGVNAAGAKVVVKGSTTVLPITLKAGEEFKKDKGIAVSIDGSGSGNGIKALLDGSCDIANSSRDMKPEEKKSAANKGIRVKEFAIAYDMVVPIVHPSNPVKNLSADQLKGIYDGSITNWKQLGGRDERIVVISRDTSSGTYEIWHERVMKKADVKKDALLQASSGSIITAVSGNKKAIGYVGFGYISNSVHGVSINGVPPTIDNGKTGKFPVSRKLFMFVNEKKFSKEASDFVSYVISPKGQGIVKEEGFIPLK